MGSPLPLLSALFPSATIWTELPNPDFEQRLVGRQVAGGLWGQVFISD